MIVEGDTSDVDNEVDEVALLDEDEIGAAMAGSPHPPLRGIEPADCISRLTIRYPDKLDETAYLRT